MDHLRDHAGQSAAEGDGARRRAERHARIGRALGTPACRAQRIRHCGYAGLSVGGCVTAERADGADILFERRGAAGLVTLNRPQALNAISRVIVTASGGRAFSAGGDLRALYEAGKAGRYDDALDYFREEYALNARI